MRAIDEERAMRDCREMLSSLLLSVVNPSESVTVSQSVSKQVQPNNQTVRQSDSQTADCRRHIAVQIQTNPITFLRISRFLLALDRLFGLELF